MRGGEGMGLEERDREWKGRERKVEVRKLMRMNEWMKGYEGR